MEQTAVKTGFIPVDTLKSTPVVDPNGEKIGMIEEILVDIDSGSIVKIILAMNNFLGLKKRVALSGDMFSMDGSGVLKVNVEKSFLKQVPAYQGEM